MQFSPQAKPPVGVIFDCDMGNGIDDALALALLYGLDGKNEARVVSVSITKSNLKAALFAEAMIKPYSGPFSRMLPIGLAIDGRMPEDTPILTWPLSRRKPDGEPLYATTIKTLNDTAEVAPLIRNALTAQHDQNAIVVLVGPATNLVAALALTGVRELIARKVRYLSMMGGAFPGGEAEFNIKSDIPAAKKLFAEWPTEIVTAGFEVGNAILYPGASIDKDFVWAPAHPLVDAYRAYKPMPYDTETWDLAAVLHAVRPKEGYFSLGTISVQDDGRTVFSASPSGKHRYLIVDPAQKERIVKAYVELISAKPVPRLPRNRQAVMPPPAEPKKEPVKP
ncbi:MAG: nucleoside hydrolase [Bryobacteraceae bacterium]